MKDDSTGDFIATSFSESRVSSATILKIIRFRDLSGMFRDEGDAVLLGVQRQLASQQQDIEFLKQRLALLCINRQWKSGCYAYGRRSFSKQESAAFRKL